MGIERSIDITSDQKKIILDLLQRYLPDTEVWAYGSRVKWTAKPHSDLDLVAFAAEEQSRQVADLREAFEESDLPFRVDFFVWDEVPKRFHENIKKESITLQNKTNARKIKTNRLDWQEMILEDMTEVIGGGTPKTNVEEYWNGDIPWVTPKDLSNYPKRHISRGERNISQQGLVNSNAKLLAKGTVLLTTRAPIGYLAIASNNVSTNQGFKSLKPKQGTNGLFLFYLLKNNIDYLKTQANGSTFQELSSLTLKSLSFLFPSLSEQKIIAHILGTLDDKIELNQKINENLENIAQTIFKSWFVDFDPVYAKKFALEKGFSKKQAERAAMAVISGICSPNDFSENFKEMNKKLTQKLSEMSKKEQEELTYTALLFPSSFEDSELGKNPKGWKVKKLSDEIEFNPKLYLKKAEFAKYVDMKALPTSGHSISSFINRKFTSGSKFQNDDTLIARITPCLENGKVAYVDCLIGHEVAWGSTEFIVMRSRKNLPNHWVYLLSRNDIFITFAVSSMSGTSGRQRVPTSVLEAYKFSFSDKNLLCKFAEIISPFFKEIKINSIENFSLKKSRDALLQKLLSGQIDLSKVYKDLVNA